MDERAERVVAEATRRLAEFVAATDYDDLPAAVQEQARLVTVDTMGVSLRGSIEPEIQQLHSRLPAGSGATLLRAGFPQADPAWAAFANATATCFLELDEGCRPVGHPGVHVLPPSLALAQSLGRSGADYLCALVLGYEVQARIGRAARLRSLVHSHGHMGHAGAIAALGKLSGWGAEQIRQGINVATALAGATSWRPCFVGATARNSYPGLSAQTAFTARLLVESGFTGYEAALGETFGEILGEGFDADALVGGLGQGYAIQNNYFKFHAACANTHPVFDAMADALEGIVRGGEYPPMPARIHPRPEEVRRIRVRVAGRGLRLAGQARANSLSSKFSIPYAAAVYLVRGNSHPDSFRGEALGDERVWDLARRVEVSADQALNAGWPAEAAAQVEVEMEDGRILRGSCSNPFGSAQNPPSPAELRAKFVAITAQVLNRPEQEALWALCLSLDNQRDMSRFPVPG